MLLFASYPGLELLSVLEKVYIKPLKSFVIKGIYNDEMIDLKETLAPKSNGSDADELRASLDDLQDITRLISGGGTIFIASVQGWAVGGGVEVLYR